MTNYNPHKLPSNMTKGSMIQDSRGNYRKVSRKEADYNFMVACFVGTVIAVIFTALVCWNTLVYCLVWAPKTRTKLLSHPINAARDMWIGADVSAP